MTDNFPDLFSDLFSELVDKRLFKKDNGESISDEDIQVAAAIFMFEVAKSDGVIDRLEIAQVINTLKRRFDLDGESVGKLIEQASDGRDGNRDLELFSEKLRQYWSHDQRMKLLRNFWEIAFADEVVDQRERDFISKSAMLLDISEADSEEIAKHAEFSNRTKKTF